MQMFEEDEEQLVSLWDMGIIFYFQDVATWKVLG